MKNLKYFLLSVLFVLLTTHAASALQSIGDYAKWTNKSIGATFQNGYTSSSALASYYTASYSLGTGVLNWTSANSTQSVSYISIHPNLYTYTAGGGAYGGDINLYVCNSNNVCNKYQIMAVTNTNPYTCGSTTSTLTYNTLGTYAVILHYTRYGASDVDLLSVAFFWALGGLITIATGDFLPFWVAHLENNLIYDLQRLFANDIVPAMLIGLLIIMVTIYSYFFIYKRFLNRRRNKYMKNVEIKEKK